ADYFQRSSSCISLYHVIPGLTRDPALRVHATHESLISPPMRLIAGFAELTNEVQHLYKPVLLWETNTNISPWKTGVRLPVCGQTGNRSGKSLQLWIARHRQSRGS